MVDGKKFCDQPTTNDLKAYDNIRKLATGQEHDYTNGVLLNYSYLKEHCKIIVIDLSKQQALDANLKAMQQSNFTVNLGEEVTMFFITEDAKETILHFSKGTLKVF